MEEIEELKNQISELQIKINKLENESKEERNAKRWRAGINKIYFFVNDNGYSDFSNEYNDNLDDYRYETRNYFKTEEEAEEYKEVMNTYYDLMDLAEELNNGEKIDWNDENQCKYFIYYDCGNDTLERTCAMKCKYLGQTYCLDENF